MGSKRKRVRSRKAASRPQEAQTGGFDMKRFAADLSLDTDTFNQCLDSGKYAAKVRDESAEAQRLGVRSTPTLFVNGRLVQNGADYRVLKTTVEGVLSQQN